MAVNYDLMMANIESKSDLSITNEPLMSFDNNAAKHEEEFTLVKKKTGGRAAKVTTGPASPFVAKQRSAREIEQRRSRRAPQDPKPRPEWGSRLGGGRTMEQWRQLMARRPPVLPPIRRLPEAFVGRSFFSKKRDERTYKEALGVEGVAVQSPGEKPFSIAEHSAKVLARHQQTRDPWYHDSINPADRRLDRPVFSKFRGEVARLRKERRGGSHDHVLVPNAAFKYVLQASRSAPAKRDVYQQSIRNMELQVVKAAYRAPIEHDMTYQEAIDGGVALPTGVYWDMHSVRTLLSKEKDPRRREVYLAMAAPLAIPETRALAARTLAAKMREWNFRTPDPKLQGLSNDWFAFAKDSGFPILVDIIAWVMVLRELESFAGFGAWCWTIVRQLGATDLLATTMGELERALREFLSMQGVPGRSAMYYVYGCLADVLESRLGKAFWAFLASLSGIAVAKSFGLIGSEPVWIAMLMQCGRSRFDSGENVLSRFFDLCKTGFEMVVECFQTGSLAPLFAKTMSLKEWRDLSYVLLHDEGIRSESARPGAYKAFLADKRAGKYPASITAPLVKVERVIMLGDLIRQGGELMAVAQRNQDAFAMRCIDSLVTELKNAEVALRNETRNGCARVQPYCVFIPGKAGLGKTIWARRFHRALGFATQQSTADDSLFRVQQSNFPDTFSPSQWFVLFDDVDQSIAPATASVANHCELVLQYINSAPLNMEAADVESKGKKWASFTAGAYCTNFYDARTKTSTLAPRAFWRRFALKVELRRHVPPGETEPEEKADEGVDAEFVDVRLLRGREPRSGEDAYRSYWEEVLPWTSDPVVYFKFIVDDYKEYMEAQLAILRGLDTDGQRHCTGCGCPEGKHKSGACVGGQFQGITPWKTMVWYFTVFFTLVMHYTAFVLGSWIALFFFTIGALFLPLALEQTAGFVAKIESSIWRLFLQYPYFLTKRAVSRWESLESYDKKVVLAKAAFGIGVIFALRKAWNDVVRPGLVHQGVENNTPEADNLFPADKTWRRLPVEVARPFAMNARPTYTKAALCAALGQRLAKLIGSHKTAMCVRLDRGFVLFNKHLVSPGGRQGDLAGNISFTVMQYGSPVGVEVSLSPDRYYRLPNKDLVLAYVPQLVPLSDGWKMVDKLTPKSMWREGSALDAACLVTPVGVMESPGRVVCDTRYPELRGPSWRGTFPTQDGYCGSPLVGTIGNWFGIVGIHGSYEDGESWAEDLPGNDVLDGMSLIESRFMTRVGDLVVDPDQFGLPSELSLQGIPAKSSLSVALTYDPFPCVVMGSIVGGTFGVTRQSKVVKTPWHAHPMVEDLRVRVGAPVYEPVRFKGEMRTVAGVERWVDPHTVSFAAYRNKGGDPTTWALAIEDYLEGVESLPGLDRMRPLSNLETFQGVEGTTLGGTNLNTSAGAPFFMNKHVCIRRTDDGDVEFRVDLIKHIEVIERTIMGGEIYSPLCVHTLKDEPVTEEKNAKLGARVFNVLPFAFNFLMKKYTAPLVAFMREYAEFFEMAYGMDITMKDVQRMVVHLTRFTGVDSKALNKHAGDKKKFQERGSTYEMLAAVEVFMRLASLSGYTTDELTMLNGLLVGSVYATHVVKQEVFVTSYTLASGYWLTLVCNSVRNCLQARYAFMRLRPCQVPFRSVVKQWVLGDDNEAGIRSDARWLGQRSVANVLREIGAELVSADKTSDLEDFMALDECTFLKRSFVLRGEKWWAPIAKETIVKLLTCRMPSKLSHMDHYSVVFDAVLAEAFLHGEEFFNEMMVMVNTLVAEYEIVSPMLRRLTYSQHMDRYVGGTFCVWEGMEQLL